MHQRRHIETPWRMPPPFEERPVGHLRPAGHAIKLAGVEANTVKDLVDGSGITFENRGVHVLKGVPGEWPLYKVAPDRPR